MCRTPEPGSPDARRPGASSLAGRWYPRENTSWRTGVCVVSGVLDAVAALTQNEALAMTARALRAMVDLIVDAGQHRRS